MSQQPPPGGPSRPQHPISNQPASDSTTTPPPAEPAPPGSTAEAPDSPAKRESTAGEAEKPQVETSTEADDETLEAQGVGPDRKAANPWRQTPAGSPEAQPATAAMHAAPGGERSSVMPLPNGASTVQAPAAPPAMVPTPSTVEGAQVAAPAPATVTRPAGTTTDELVYTPFALSVGDGFRLGCGIVLAVFVTIMGVVLLAAIGFLLASMAGLNIPIGI